MKLIVILVAIGSAAFIAATKNPADVTDAPCDMNQIQQSIARLEDQNRELELRLSQQTSRLEEENRLLGERQDQSAKAISKLNYDNQLLKAEVKQLVKNNLKLQENMKSISKAPQKQAANATFVSFTATPSETKSYVQGDVVIFDETIRSYGSGYNTDLSVFECPVSGYYFFFVSLYTSMDLSLQARVFIDGESFNPMVTSASTDNSASNLVVAHCDFEQLVWVKSDGIGTLQGNSRSTFTGTLLHAD